MSKFLDKRWQEYLGRLLHGEAVQARSMEFAVLTYAKTASVCTAHPYPVTYSSLHCHYVH